MEYTFNSPPVFGSSIEEPTQEEIENTLNLRQVDLETAARYGGTVTRAALGAMSFVGDRKNIVVDTKIHMLLPGFVPSIPGWHTDGVPRGDTLDPGGRGAPRFDAQLDPEKHGITTPRYHLLVTGSHSPTRFLTKPLTMNIDPGIGSRLYKDMSSQVNRWLREQEDPSDFYVDSKPSTVMNWDWWSVHTAQPATARGWRYLIRATETDHIEPRTNPSDFIRTQNQVYVPAEFGW